MPPLPPAQGVPTKAAATEGIVMEDIEDAPEEDAPRYCMLHVHLLLHGHL